MEVLLKFCLLLCRKVVGVLQFSEPGNSWLCKPRDLQCSTTLVVVAIVEAPTIENKMWKIFEPINLIPKGAMTKIQHSRAKVELEMYIFSQIQHEIVVSSQIWRNCTRKKIGLCITTYRNLTLWHNPVARNATAARNSHGHMGISEILFYSLVFIYFSRFDTHFHDRKTKFRPPKFLWEPPAVFNMMRSYRGGKAAIVLWGMKSC